jgi:hypothetical protein
MCRDKVEAADDARPGAVPGRVEDFDTPQFRLRCYTDNTKVVVERGDSARDMRTVAAVIFVRGRGGVDTVGAAKYLAGEVGVC